MPASSPPVRELISVFEAREEILRASPTGGTEEIPLRSAVGRVLRKDASADTDIPPFDNSAMDGFAVSLQDFDGDTVVLSIGDEVQAGAWPSRPVGNGSCSRIMTGAPVPEGTDAVVPVEWCQSDGVVGGTVTITRRPKRGQHVRKRGSDIAAGTLALKAPASIEPRTIGVLASLGCGQVTVAVRPTISIVATGDELIEASDTPKDGQIRNSNGPTLAAMASASGALVVAERVARDSADHTRQVLQEALKADIVIISGGVSVGSYDYVKTVLDEMGIERRFWRVRQRPGKPLTFGKIGDHLVFGLPGNPVSTAVCFRQYVLPAIRKTLGLPHGPQFLSAQLTETVQKVSNLHFFIPGKARVDDEGRLTVARSGAFGSHIFSSLAAANCLISLPEGSEAIGAGSIVEVELFNDL